MRSMGNRVIDRIRMRWRSLWHRDQLEHELREELAFHQAELVAQYEQQGLAPAEARRRARLELGGPAQISEETRDQRGWRRTDQLIRDTRVAFRQFRKHPGFALTAILTIALGMGANTALFTVMHSALFRPLPVADPGTLRNVYLQLEHSARRASFGSPSFVSFREFIDIRAGTNAADIAGISAAEVSWRGLAGRSVRAQLVSENLLPMIGARPTLGRFFTREETSQPGSAPVVVLSHAFWQRQLGGDRAIIGKPVTLNRTPFTVIGVADSGTRGPLIQTAEVWLPITMQRLTRPDEHLIDDPSAAWIQMFTRQRPGLTDAAVAADVQLLAARAVAAYDSSARVTALVVPAAFMNMPGMRRDAFPVLALLWLAFSMILVVSCANVANMLLARSLSRQREIAVRLAIGAGRGRLLVQLLTESGWLGILGGGLGLAIAFGLGSLVRAMAPAEFGLQLDVTPDRAVLAFTGVVSILSGLVFGLLPALQVTSLDLSPGLKADGLPGGGRPRGRLQQTLVAVQVAVCVVLLVNAGLLVRSFNQVFTMDTGRPLDHMLIGSFDLRQQQYTAGRAEAFFHQLSERLLATPGVAAAGTSILDPELGFSSSFVRVGDSTSADQAGVQTAFDEVGSGYFKAAGLAVLAGRTFTEAEVRSNAAVMVVDQRMAEQKLGGRPVGQRVWLEVATARRAYEVIGVVPSTEPIAMGVPRLPTYYVPIAGARYLEGRMWVRYQGKPGPVAAAIRAATDAADRELTPTVKTIEENLQLALLPMRIASGSLTALGALALALASIGLFGVIGFAVARRAREIAIRMALGAAPREVLGLVGRQALAPVGSGLAAGLVLAVAAGHLIRGVLHGVSPFDPAAIGTVILAVGAGSALAFWVPARRAVTTRPATVLRVD